MQIWYSRILLDLSQTLSKLKLSYLVLCYTVPNLMFLVNVLLRCLLFLTNFTGFFTRLVGPIL